MLGLRTAMRKAQYTSRTACQEIPHHNQRAPTEALLDLRDPTRQRSTCLLHLLAPDRTDADLIDRKPYHCIEPGCMSPKGGLTSFARRDELTRHYQTHRGEDRELFACPVAGCNRSGAYGLPRRDKLNDHLRTVHKMSNQAIRY